MIINLEDSVSYTEPGATAVDYASIDISDQIAISGIVDTSIEFDVNDSDTEEKLDNELGGFFYFRYCTVYYRVRGITISRQVTVIKMSS